MLAENRIVGTSPAMTGSGEQESSRSGDQRRSAPSGALHATPRNGFVLSSESV